MGRLKRILAKSIYYSGTYALISSLQKLRSPRTVVLMYHRVDSPTYPTDVISALPEEFDKQMEWLKEKKQVITFDHFATGNIGPSSIIITFDDGYKDNFTNAYPTLCKHRLPASIGLATYHIGNDELFWWDRITEIVMHTKKKYFMWKDQYIDLKDKLRGCVALQEYLKTISEFEKQQLMNALQDQLKVKPKKNKDLFLDWEDIMQMDNIEFVSHTHTHPILTRLSSEAAHDQVSTSKKIIESKTGQEVKVFTYPNGTPQDMSEELDGMLKEMGFTYALSCRSGSSKPHDFNLKRVPINIDDDLITFKVKCLGLEVPFQNWVAKVLA